MSVEIESLYIEPWNMDDYVNLFIQYVGNRLKYIAIETIYGPNRNIRILKKTFHYLNPSKHPDDPAHLIINFQFQSEDSNIETESFGNCHFNEGRPLRIWIGNRFTNPNGFLGTHVSGEASTYEYPFWNIEREAKDPMRFFSCWLETIDNMHLEINIRQWEGRTTAFENIRQHYEARCQYYQQRHSTGIFSHLQKLPFVMHEDFQIGTWKMDDYINFFINYIGDRLKYNSIEVIYAPDLSISLLKNVFYYTTTSPHQEDPKYLKINFQLQSQEVKDLSNLPRSFVNCDYNVGRRMRIWIGNEYTSPNFKLIGDPFSDTGMCEFPYWDPDKEAKNPVHFFTCWLQTVDNMHSKIVREPNYDSDNLLNILPHYKAQCQYYLDRETTRFLLRFRRNPYFPDDNVDGISKFLGR